MKNLTADPTANPPDYTVSDSSVTFIRNSDSQSIEINAEDDDVVESEESFTLTLDDPENDGDVNFDDPHQLTVIIESADGKRDTFSPAASHFFFTSCTVLVTTFLLTHFVKYGVSKSTQGQI